MRIERTDMAGKRLRIQAPVDARLALLHLVGIGDAGFRLSLESQSSVSAYFASHDQET